MRLRSLRGGRLQPIIAGIIAILLHTPATAQTNALQVANNSALQALSTTAAPNGVWRNTFGNGNGAEPLFYAPQSSACSLNSGNGDNGLQVKSADGKCWIAQFPAAGASVKQFGAYGDASTAQHDDTAAVQAAVNDLPGNGYRILVPSGGYCLSTGPVIVPAAPTAGFATIGFATIFVGYGNQSAAFKACNHDVTLIEWEGSGGGIYDVGFSCRGSSASDTFSFSKPCLYLHGAGENAFWNLTITGGLYTVLADNNSNANRFYNLYAYDAYGLANILAQGGIIIDNSTIDQSWPVNALTSANISSFSAWASGQAYPANTVVTVFSAIENLTYLIQCNNCNGSLISSGSAPTLQPYGAPMNNGSDSLEWYLVGTNGYIGVDCDTGCAGTILSNTDVAGPYLNNVAMTNSLGGTSAPVGLLLKNVTTSFNITTAIYLSAGGLAEIDGGSIVGCAANGCAAIFTTASYSGATTIYGEQIVGTTYGVVDAAGTQLTLGLSVINSISSCFLTENSVTKFSVMNNQCSNVAGAITVNNGSDFYSIIGNITGATTENGNVSWNSSPPNTHNTVTGNW
jgi:hypothetical protein